MRETVDSSEERTAVSGTHRPTRWYQRVVPVSTLALALVAIAAAVVPGFADQLEQSLTRQHAPYVELYFDQPMAATTQTACLRRGDSVRVRFVVESHLPANQRLAYRVRVQPLGGHQRPLRQAGRLTVSPGEAAVVRRTFRLPAGRPYAVRVHLPALDQHLRIRCAAGRS
jgi:hypothetical protein